MKPVKLIHIILIIFMLFLYACGGGGGGGGGGSDTPPGGGEVKKQYSLTVTHEGEGSVSVSPYSQGLVYDEGTTVSLEAAASSSEWSFDHWEGTIESTDSNIDISMNQNYSLKAVFIKVAQSLTREQIENALYAVYGGIGYNDREDTNDDALMYKLMVDNLNSIGIELITTTISGDPNFATKLLSLLLFPSVTFTSTTSGYTSSITINREPLNSGYYPFNATLSVAFNSNGYSYGSGAGMIYGTGQVSDFTATFTGDFKYTNDSLTLIIRSVRVTAGNGLETIEGGVTTSYNNWELAYDINYGSDDPMGGSGTPTNLALIVSFNTISGDKTYADFRDYKVGGSFTTNDKEFTFADGFRYKQEQYNYIRNNTTVTYVIMSANGWVSVPGLEGNISVSSSIDKINPDTSGTIITHVFENNAWSSNWLSGNLSFATSEGTASAVFDDGSVAFTSGADSWVVPDWQTALNPLE